MNRAVSMVRGENANVSGIFVLLKFENTGILKC
jgi:hypothetical protein